MLMRKTWERSIPTFKGSLSRYHDVYTGWFLFGFIPLYITRDRSIMR